MEKTIIEKRLAFWNDTLDELYTAYAALVKGGVKSYRIDDRELTRFDLFTLMEEIKEAEEKVNDLTALLDGQKPRKAFGIIPRDW